MAVRGIWAIHSSGSLVYSRKFPTVEARVKRRERKGGGNYRAVPCDLEFLKSVEKEILDINAEKNEPIVSCAGGRWHLVVVRRNELILFALPAATGINNTTTTTTSTCTFNDPGVALTVSLLQELIVELQNGSFRRVELVEFDRLVSTIMPFGRSIGVTVAKAKKELMSYNSNSSRTKSSEIVRVVSVDTTNTDSISSSSSSSMHMSSKTTRSTSSIASSSPSTTTSMMIERSSLGDQSRAKTSYSSSSSSSNASPSSSTGRNKGDLTLSVVEVVNAVIFGPRPCEQDVKISGFIHARATVQNECRIRVSLRNELEKIYDVKTTTFTVFEGGEVQADLFPTNMLSLSSSSSSSPYGGGGGGGGGNDDGDGRRRRRTQSSSSSSPSHSESLVLCTYLVAGSPPPPPPPSPHYPVVVAANTQKELKQNCPQLPFKVKYKVLSSTRKAFTSQIWIEAEDTTTATTKLCSSTFDNLRIDIPLGQASFKDFKAIQMNSGTIVRPHGDTDVRAVWRPYAKAKSRGGGERQKGWPVRHLSTSSSSTISETKKGGGGGGGGGGGPTLFQRSKQSAAARDDGDGDDDKGGRGGAGGRRGQIVRRASLVFKVRLAQLDESHVESNLKPQPIDGPTSFVLLHWTQPKTISGIVPKVMGERLKLRVQESTRTEKVIIADQIYFTAG